MEICQILMKYIPPSNQTSWSISLLRKKKWSEGGLSSDCDRSRLT